MFQSVAFDDAPGRAIPDVLAVQVFQPVLVIDLGAGRGEEMGNRGIKGNEIVLADTLSPLGNRNGTGDVVTIQFRNDGAAKVNGLSLQVDPPGAASGDDDIMVSAILCR